VVQTVNELQTAIGLVAAGIGITLVPASVQRLHRDDIGYTPLSDSSATSPIVVSYRAADVSPVLQQCLSLLSRR
jgi:DNA-binding transcriptional LysR family regulator